MPQIHSIDPDFGLIQGGEKGIVTRNICDTFVQYLILLKDEKNGIKKAKKWLGGILSLIKENMDCRAKDLMPIFYFKAIVCWLVYQNYQEIYQRHAPIMSRPSQIHQIIC